MKITVVIPAYNEEKIIAKVVGQVKEKNQDVIVVDDGSSDATAEAASQAGAKVIKHFLNRGQGAALRTGIIFALRKGSDVIVTFDADGQHDAGDINKMIEPLLLGEFDVTLGSRFLESKFNDIPLAKVIILKLAVWFTRLYTGLKVTDVHNGLRAFSKKSAGLIQLRQDGMAHASEILEEIKRHRLKFTEIPVTVSYTDYSLRKGQKISNSFRILWDLIIGRISR
ncbi:glycosyltransferase family 2 protein [Candidatus Falkowbacteria bacterium]|nr:glycosyltransferase family 2 protein [Candidatus Falkowbacteria bacterium]